MDYSIFINLFRTIAPEKHRYTVFSDFVTMSAISFRNVVEKNAELEAEYLKMVSKYKKEEVQKICQLLGILTDYLDDDPRDCLGSIFMDLGFGEDMKGQFFTPEPVCDLMAQSVLGEGLEVLKTRPFITVSDPACGAGAMLLSAAKWVRRAGYSLESSLWVQAIDIDRVTALMCYVQLSLWFIPAEVIVGNTLTKDYREHWFTFAHHAFNWTNRLKYADDLSPEELEKSNPAEKAESNSHLKSTSPRNTFKRMEQDSFDF